MPKLTEKQLEKLKKLEQVKINGVELLDQERIFLCWLLKREYADLTYKIMNTISQVSFSKRQAEDEMIICLRLLSLIERSNRKWIMELSLFQEK